jgi:hypothetical protein
MDVERQAGFAGRAQQEGFHSSLRSPSPQLPIQTRPSRGLPGRRMKQAGVGRLVPGPDALAPAPAAIDLRQRLAEGQHAVIAIEVEGADASGSLTAR